MTMKTYSQPFDAYPDLKDTEIDYRGFTLLREKSYTLWEIKANKGDLPLELSSKFTTMDLAKGRIDRYLDETNGND